MVKTKRATLLVLCAVCILSLIVGVATIVSGNKVHSVSAESTSNVSIEDAKLKLSFETKTGHVSFGADREKPLDADESLILQYTLLQDNITGTPAMGFLIAKEYQLESIYPYNFVDSFMVYGQGNGNALMAGTLAQGSGGVALSGSGSGILGNLYSTDATYGGQHNVKVTYTPYQTDSNTNGIVTIETSPIDTANWTEIYRVELPNNAIASPDHKIYLFFTGTGAIGIENYKIYTTKGANLLGVREADVDETITTGTLTREIGLYYAFGESTASISVLADKYNQKFTYTSQVSAGAPTTKIPENGKLILSYKVASGNANVATSTPGFAVIKENINNAALWGNASYAAAFYLYSNGISCFSINANATLGTETTADGIKKGFTTGNKIEVHYTPDWANNNGGSMVMYLVNADGSLQQLASIINIGRTAVYDTASIHIVQQGGSFTLADYNVYTEVSGERTIAFDGTKENASIFCAGNTGVTVTPTTEKLYKQTFSYSNQGSFGAPTTTIPTNGKLVLRYTVESGNPDATTALPGFAAIKENIDNSALFGNASFTKSFCLMNGTVYSYGATADGTAANITKGFTAGNTIEVQYIPDWANNGSGSLKMYLVGADGSLEYIAGAINIDKSVVYDVASIHIIQTKGSFTLSNYKVFTEVNEQRTMVFDGTAEVPGFFRADGPNDYINVTPVEIEVKKTVVGMEENTLTVKNLQGETDYVIYTAKGATYELPNAQADYDGDFFKWSVGEAFYDAGANVTLNDNLVAEPIGVKIDMVDGASIRSNKPYGLKFSTDIDYALYNKLTAYATEIKTGTLILPKDTLTVDFTKAALDGASIKHKDVTNEGWANATSAETDGKYEFHGSIVGILDHNLARTFSAVSYISFKLGNETYTVYSNQVDRSVNQVAKLAVQLGVFDQTVVNDITKLYVDSVIEIDENNNIVTFDGYITPYQIAIDGNVITVTAIDGSEITALKCAVVNGVIVQTVLSGDNLSATITLA